MALGGPSMPITIWDYSVRDNVGLVCPLPHGTSQPTTGWALSGIHTYLDYPVPCNIGSFGPPQHGISVLHIMVFSVQCNSGLLSALHYLGTIQFS